MKSLNVCKIAIYLPNGKEVKYYVVIMSKLERMFGGIDES